MILVTVLKLSVVFMLALAGLICAYHLGLLLIALLSNRKRLQLPSKASHRFAIVIPAHNEEATLGCTLASCHKLDYPLERYAVYVIVDNCTDRTSEIATSRGCRCLHRVDTERRGKGFALSWALPQVLADGWDAVVILDADCRLDAHALRAFDACLDAGDLILQSNDVVANTDESPTSYMLAVANCLENDMFYAPKSLLGLSVFLRGTGMVFHRSILEQHHWSADSLVEDTEFTLLLVESNIPIRFLRDTRVQSAFPTLHRDLRVQRARWTGGAVKVGVKRGVQLIGKGIISGHWLSLDAGFTSLILSRPLVIAQLVFTTLASMVLNSIRPDRWTQAFVTGCICMFLNYLVYAMIGVFQIGITKRRLLLMLLVPWCALRYMLMTFIVICGKIPSTWERTPRPFSVGLPETLVPSFNTPPPPHSVHIAQLTSSRFFGGPERQMLELAESLRPQIVTTFISFSEGGLCRSFLDAAQQKGFEALELSNDTPHLMAAAAELRELLQNRNVGLLLCQGYKADLLGLWVGRKAAIPVAATSRGWTGENYKVRLYDTLDKRVLRWMDHVVCVSEGQAQKVRAAGVGVKKISVIHNSIRTERFAENDDTYGEWLRALFPNPPRRIIGAAGRLSSEKGFDILIDAAAQVCRNQPDVGFVLFGDGPLRSSLSILIEKRGLQGRFLLGGFTDALDHYLPHFDIFAQSSYTEGLPNVILESFAAGVPVVATAVGGTPEVVVHGENGFLVPPGDPAALARHLCELLNDPTGRETMGKAGRKRVELHFSFDAQAEKYKSLFCYTLGREIPAGKAIDNSQLLKVG